MAEEKNIKFNDCTTQFGRLQSKLSDKTLWADKEENGHAMVQHGLAEEKHSKVNSGVN